MKRKITISAGVCVATIMSFGLHVLCVDSESLQAASAAVAPAGGPQEADLAEAERLIRMDRAKEAMNIYDAAIQKKKSAAAYAGRGYAWLSLKDADAAVKDIDEALAIDPNYAPALCFRALLQLMQGQLTEARTLADRALSLAPDLPWAHLAKAQAMLPLCIKLSGEDRKQYCMEAEAEMKRAVELDPHFALAQFGLASLWFGLANGYGNA